MRRVVSDHAAELAGALAKHGGTNPRLFGSVARGTARIDSDVDILVDVSDHVSLFDLLRMQADAEEILGLHVDIVPAGSLKPHVRDQVLREAVAL